MTMSTCRVAVIGAGYVGLPTAVTLATFGHQVVLAESNPERLAILRSGTAPIYEPGLDAALAALLDAGTLRVSDDAAEASKEADVVFLCVPTPQGDDGSADLGYVLATVAQIASSLQPGAIVVNKSTVPVGTAQRVAAALGRTDVAVVSNPEFLREGMALNDSFRPDRIVVGAEDATAARAVADLFAATGSPVVLTSTATAETIKYSSNAFLAVKLSFINAMAGFCEIVGADVRELVAGLGYDPRIGDRYLAAGPGWGGSCLPKDTAALLHMSVERDFDFELLRGAIHTNEAQLLRMVDKIARVAGGLEGKTIGLWGLTFKANTDDRRCSPAVDIAQRLLAAGARVQAYDPMVHGPGPDLEGIDLVGDVVAAATDAHAVALLTEWAEFQQAPWDRVAAVMANPGIVDTRNLLDPATVRAAGLVYEGVGSR
jgi:UDPglucose 6-dehydrogenase